MLRRPLRSAVLAASLLLTAAPAFAQSPGLAGQDRVGAAPFGSAPSPGLEPPPRAPRSALAPLSPSAQPWPRLEPGAVLCRTQQDLRRRALEFENPASTGAGPVYCRQVPRATPITVLQRAGQGETEVRVTAPDGETGWTDAFLPEKAPR